MLTKIIDAHPDVGVLMENIFDNRRRHWVRADFWSAESGLRRRVEDVYSRISEPVIGNKVCTPDVWSADDIHRFCRLFTDFTILFIVREPESVLVSRYKRGDHENEFNEAARANLLLDFRSLFHTYASSWRQSIEIYRALRDRYPDKVKLLYYDDFASNFDDAVDRLPDLLGVERSDELRRWNEKKHYDAQGRLRQDLKYKDREVRRSTHTADELPADVQADFADAMQGIEAHRKLWEERAL